MRSFAGLVLMLIWDDSSARSRGVRTGMVRDPVPGTVRNAFNGAALTAPRALSDGDVLAAGRVAKAITKLPLTARVG